MKNFTITKLILLVFIISWMGILPSILAAYGYAVPEFLKHLHILMTLGPMIGALMYIYASQKRKGITHFFKRFLLFKTKSYVILMALLSPVILTFLAAYIGIKITGTPWPSSYDFATIITSGCIITLGYLIGNTEELAWRGVVFDHLLKKYGFLKSCAIIMPIWWLFHIPLFLYPNGHPAGYGILEFTAFVIPMTIILGWIYVQTKRSLFYIHMHHQLFNGFGEAFPIFPIFIAGNLIPVRILGILLILLAILLLCIRIPKSIALS